MSNMIVRGARGLAAKAAIDAEAAREDITSVSVELAEKAPQERTVNRKNIGLAYRKDSNSDWGYRITKGLLENSSSYLDKEMYYINTSISYTKELNVLGSGWSFGGTGIAPSGDFPAFTPSEDFTDRTRNQFKEFMIDGRNLSQNTPAMVFERAYLTTVEKVYFRACGVKITDSDSLRFIDCRFMDGVTKELILEIGEGSRSINFIGCNFENYNDKVCRVRVIGSPTATQMTTNVNFTNCQTERAVFEFDYCSNCVIDASKFHRTRIILGEHTNNCRVINIADSASIVQDYGVNNTIENCSGQNLGGFSTTKKMLKSDFIATSDNYGVQGKEYLFIASIMPSHSGAIVNGKMSYTTDAGVLLRETIPLTLKSDIGSVGGGIRQTFTDFNTFKIEGTHIVVAVSAESGSPSKKVVLKENKLVNGTFKQGTDGLTGWDRRYPHNITPLLENGRLKITVTDNSPWGVRQNVLGLDENKVYMLMCKTSAPSAAAVAGTAWDGAAGRRTALGETYQTNDGNYISQCFFTGQHSTFVSLGTMSGGQNGQSIFIDWIALVEVD